jgi:hypothetical protein
MAFNEQNTVEHFIIHQLRRQKATLKLLKQKLLNQILG